MKKLAVVVGHNSRDKGAYAAGLKESEYDFNKEVAFLMEELASEYGIEVGIFYRSEKLGYSRQIEKAYKEADRWGADLSVELHFNAIGRKLDNPYTVTLASTSRRSLRWAQNAQKKMEYLFGRDGRFGGVRTTARNKRGGFSLYAGKAPACLVEPFFGSERSECELMREIGKEAYARCLLEAASDTFGVLPRKSLAGSRTIYGAMGTGTGTSLAVAGEALRDVSYTIGGIGHISTVVTLVGAFIAIVSTILIAYARIDDHRNARR